MNKILFNLGWWLGSQVRCICFVLVILIINLFNPLATIKALVDIGKSSEKVLETLKKRGKNND